MEDIVRVIVLDGLLLGTMGLALMSAVSMIGRKHRRGVLFGVASMVAYMLFAWQWYTPFAQHDSFFAQQEITWFELAFRAGSRAFRVSMVFLAIGLVMTLANVLAIIRQKKVSLSAPTGTD